MSNSTMPQVGSHFGNYVIERLLDHGGMGYVYLVRHPVLRVERALKVLDPSRRAAGGDFVERFNREAQLVCRIHHPNLVEVFDAGLDAATGLRYIVMEYVPGGTLRGRLKSQGRIPWREALGIVRQTAEALAAVARRGSVHRDIKPENIMFAADGSVRLADFGIAKAAADDEEDTLQTQSDQAFGTPSYMSPEQVRSAASVDGRADIWSLGVVLFEMLVGQRPYRARSVAGIVSGLLSDKPFPNVRTALAEALAAPPADDATAMTVPAMETAATIAVAAHAPNVGDMPDSVVRLVSAMCEKNVERRMATCEEVIGRIDAILGNGPAPAAAKARARAPRFVAVAMAVAAAAAAATAAYVALSRRMSAPFLTPPATAPTTEEDRRDDKRAEPPPEPVPVAPAASGTERKEAPAAHYESVVEKRTAESPPASLRKPDEQPMTPGCTVCIGGEAEGAVSRSVRGVSGISRAVAEAVAARASSVILSPAEACARADVSLNGYALAVANACDALRRAGIACRYRRSAGESVKSRQFDEAARKICTMHSVTVE